MSIKRRKGSAQPEGGARPGGGAAHRGGAARGIDEADLAESEGAAERGEAAAERSEAAAERSESAPDGCGCGPGNGGAAPADGEGAPDGCGCGPGNGGAAPAGGEGAPAGGAAAPRGGGAAAGGGEAAPGNGEASAGNGEAATGNGEAAPGDGEAAPGRPDADRELASLRAELEAKERQRAECLDKLQRCAAEFDNYKKRTLREKESLYSEAAGDTIAAFLPILDNLERASAPPGASAAAKPDAAQQRCGDAPAGEAQKGGHAGGEAQKGGPQAEGPAAEASLREGIALVLKQMRDILGKLGVEPLPGAGEPFDPNCHDAVMHVEDGGLGSNVVAEVFVKGYRHKDRIIRHSMVKVAN